VNDRHILALTLRIVIQNAGQVNIAAEGGQQVNVKGKRRKKATEGKRSKKSNKPKQLSALEQIINLEPAPEIALKR
jgi:hypothetical protein